ncbi:MAG: glycosyltransferase family 39 protein [Gammaproteobacteria bacterium]
MLQSLKQLYSEIRRPVIVPCTGSYAIAGLVITTDLAVSLSLFFSGNSIALSHISGFFAAGFLLLLLRLFAIDKSAASISGDTTFQKVLSVIGYILVQAAIRGGSIASLTHFGLLDSLTPELGQGLIQGLNLGLGILLAVLIGSFSSSLLLTRPGYRPGHNNGHHSGNASYWLSLGITLAVCVFALRLVFLGGMELIPQETYYWNYAQHMSPGYLDHPPLVAATIYTGEVLFGHNAWGTRFGAFVYGLLFIFIFYRYARLQVDRNCAAFASVFALLLPYFFLGTGFFIVPDAPLSLAWVMALYFFYRALVKNEARAWYGVGLAMGIGMLSKYTIVLLAPAALLYIVIDPQARRHLLRKEPYIATVIAVLVFSPVIYWNATNDWASFAFHASGRFEKIPHFFLGMMLTNILAMVTPLPLLALPYLFTAKAVRDDASKPASLQSPFNFRVRLFIGIFLLAPMSVFAWNALENEPRYNWTGPLWITLLPMLAWLTVNASKLRWRWIGLLFDKLTVPLLFALIGLYAILLHFISIGLPGVDFPRGSARLIGWPEVSRNILAIQEQLPADSGRVVVAGMDKYFIASKLSYYGTEEFLGDNKKLRVTGNHLVGDNSLMFAYWNPAEEFKGDTVIMLSRSKSDFTDKRLQPYFEKLSPDVVAFPVYKNDFGLPQKTIREYYYRIGFGYKPPQPEVFIHRDKLK